MPFRRYSPCSPSKRPVSGPVAGHLRLPHPRPVDEDDIQQSALPGQLQIGCYGTGPCILVQSIIRVS